LGVGGVLTYEDVTNVDSVGVITARSGINVSSGRLLLGAGAIANPKSSGAGSIDLDNQAFSIMVGGNHPSGGRSNNNAKTFRMSMVHYALAEEPINILQGYCDSSDNNVYIGGGTGSANSLTSVRIYTGANTTTTGGTERFRIHSAGQIGLSGANYGTAGQVLTSQGSSSAVQWATPSSGLSDFDTWYLTQDTVGNTNPVQNNWSRWTNHGGTGSVTFAAPSSGVWTFPSTGYWLIEWYGRFTITNATERGCNADIYVTTNNSYYAFVTQASCNMGASHSSGVKGVARASYIFDVTDVSTHKMKLSCGYQQVTGTLTGHGAYLYSHVKFFKLRDT